MFSDETKEYIGGPGFSRAPWIHYPSEQVFNRLPITIPYDSPIFVCVQNGDVDGMKGLLISGMASVDAVDPYGLGLLHVRKFPLRA